MTSTFVRVSGFQISLKTPVGAGNGGMLGFRPTTSFSLLRVSQALPRSSSERSNHYPNLRSTKTPDCAYASGSGSGQL